MLSLFSLWVAYRHWADYCPKAKRRSPKVWMLDYLKTPPATTLHWCRISETRPHTATLSCFRIRGVTTSKCMISCNRLDHLIARKKTNYRSPITTSKRLSLTLNFLTTGLQYNVKRNGYVAAKPSVSKIVA